MTRIEQIEMLMEYHREVLRSLRAEKDAIERGISYEDWKRERQSSPESENESGGGS